MLTRKVHSHNGIPRLSSIICRDRLPQSCSKTERSITEHLLTRLSSKNHQAGDNV